MAIRPSKFVLLIRAVDVDEAAACIDDPSQCIHALIASYFQPIEPQDAGSDEVVLWSRPLGGEYARRLTRFEDHPRDGAFTDLFADHMQPNWGLE